MAKRVTKERQEALKSAADILKDTASSMGVKPNKASSKESTTIATPKEDPTFTQVKNLISEHEKGFSDISIRITQLEKLVQELSRKLSHVDMRVSTVVNPQERDLPAEVAAGLDITSLYTAGISGCFAGIFAQNRHLNSYESESKRETLVKYTFLMGDTFLKSLNDILGAVAKEKELDD